MGVFLRREEKRGKRNSNGYLRRGKREGTPVWMKMEGRSMGDMKMESMRKREEKVGKSKHVRMPRLSVKALHFLACI